MILKRAIKEFLSKPRDNLQKWKDLTLDDLWGKWEHLEHAPPIWKKLKIQQKVCLLLAIKYKKVAFFLDTGLGKTLLSIAIARYCERAGHVNRFIVMVPNRINLFEWEREVAKHSKRTTVSFLRGSSEEKWRILEEEGSLLNVVTYMGLSHMVCDMVNLKKPKKGQKQRLEPSYKLLNRLKKQVGGVILDESTAVGNHASLPFRVCRQLTKTADYFIALTGTPFGRDPQPLWSQMFLIDGGYTLGTTLGMFRAAFYDSVINYWGGHEHKFLKEKERQLHRFLAHRSIRYELDDADLPNVVHIKREVRPPVDAEAYAEKLREQLRASRGNYQEIQNSFTRMRQLSSGFIGFKDDDYGDKVELEFVDKPKLELLLDIIASIREDYKIVVAYDFIKSGKIISAALKEEKVNHVLVSGKVKNPEREMEKFIKDPKCRVFALNTVGAYGLNLQMARYMLFYESPVSVILRKQMQRRVERQGSKYKRVFIYDLVTTGTYDEDILKYHAEGKDLFEAIVDGNFGTLL